MPLLLRTVRENRWYKAPAVAWLERGDVPADPIGDLATSQNALSVWLVEPDRSNLERVVRAVAIGKQKVDSAGWVIFDSDLLGPLGIGMVEAPGGTKDEAANAWHRDLVDLSGNKLIALAKTILERGESGTIPKKRIAQLIEDGIRNNELPDSLRGRLEL
ncbi:MAG: hypothetical protein HY655_06655 [Acidobacteria bacterium]|nr:hypothetical protein [Acidobacteriota bacterium]